MNSPAALPSDPPATPSSASPAHTLPSLDGWRALSIALVLCSHSPATVGISPRLAHLSERVIEGDFGVRFFFVISGFLITWLLIRETRQAGRVNLAHFYLRRGLRIIPVYAVFLGVLALLQATTPFSQSPRTWIGNLTFTSNFTEHANWTSAHLWSLAVEEQFYVIWPTLFVAAGLAGNFRRSCLILLIPCLAAPLFRALDHTQIASVLGWPPLIFSFFNYFDSPALGCACAMVFVFHEQAVRRFLTRRPGMIAAAAAALIVVPLLLNRLFLVGFLTIPFKNSLQILGIALLLLQSLLLPDRGFYRMLNWGWVRQIGVLSYSIYIWQQIFCSDPAIFGLPPSWCFSFPTWMIPAVAVAVVSYYGLERPLFRLRARFR